MSKIDFSKLGSMLESKTNLSLTEKQYEKIIGKKLPKSNSYLKNKSPLSKYVNDLGYIVVVKERTVSFEKIIEDNS